MKKKILQICDVPGWAIDKLASAYRGYNDHLDWEVIYVHPKAIEREEVDLAEIEKHILAADIIDAHYWRTLAQLAEKIPALKEKVVILNHHNEKNLLSEDWSYVDWHVAHTERSVEILAEISPKNRIVLIHNSYDHTQFVWSDEYAKKEWPIPLIGYVGRIVPWKGLKEICRAAYELKAQVLFMGKIDKPSYLAEIPSEHQATIDWSFLNCDDDARLEYYQNLMLYVGNSGSGRETGPLGLLEAMAVGVPVVTTRSGIAADILEHEENALVVDFDDYDGLKHEVKRMIESPQLRLRLRQGAWDTVRGYNNERAAMRYRAFLNKILYETTLVSVIIPATYDRIGEVLKILAALEEQTYKDIEAVVVFDEIASDEQVTELSKFSSIPIKVLFTNAMGYNLAMARNLGVIAADGEVIVFCDSRMEPAPDAVEKLVTELPSREAKIWAFGEKGGAKDTFVENFSAINRKQLIKAGMFNERINEYGGMSQELRERFGAQGFTFVYVPEAKAKQLTTARKNSARRQSIVRMKNLLHRLHEKD